MQGRDIIIVSTQDFDDLRTRKQRWAERLAADNRVLYVETQMHWVTLLRNWSLHKSRLRRSGRSPRMIAPNLWVWTPPIVMPFFQMSRILSWFNSAWIGRALRRVVRALDFEDTLLWLYTPYSSSLIDVLEPAHTVYECVDDFSAAKGLIRPSVVRRFEDRTFRRADLTLVTADRLADIAVGKARELRISHNACDTEFFARAALSETPVHPTIGDLPGPVLGFVGAVAYWVDLDLLAKVAAAWPEATIVLVGPVRVDIKPYQHIPNLRFLGRQPYEQIPQFLRGFDVCLNPYKPDDVAVGASPLKLYEYVASGRPVVSTDMPEAQRFSDIVSIAQTSQAFTDACRRLSSEEPAAKLWRERRQASIARRHTWSKRFDEVERWLEELGIAAVPDLRKIRVPKAPLTLRRPREVLRPGLAGTLHVVVNGLQVNDPSLGGGYTYLTNLLRAMVSSHPETRFTVLATRRGARLFDWPLPNLRLVPLDNAFGWGPLRFFYERFLVHRTLRELGASVYFLPYGALPRTKVCPQVMTFQNLYFLQAQEFSQWKSPTRFGRFYERHRLSALTARLLADVQAADSIVAVSQTAGEALSNRLYVPKEKIDVIYEAVGQPFIAEGDTEDDPLILRNLGIECPYFLSVGAIAPNKNLPLLLEAYARFVHGCPDGPKLMLAGPDWQGFSQVIDLSVEQFDLQSHVRRLGHVEQESLAVLYRNAVATVQLSTCESFGLPALEAMACGTPLVVANRSGLAEVASKNAIQVDPQDTSAIAEALLRLSRENAWRAHWIRRGRNRARQFTWDSAANQTYGTLSRTAGQMQHEVAVTDEV